MVCKAGFDGAQKKSGLMLPYLQREIREEEQRNRERSIAAKAQAKADADAFLQTKHDADICADFGKMLTKYDLTSFFIDEKRLPHSKAEIRSAILRQIKRNKKNKKVVGPLETALVCLPSFQPKIGIKPIPRDMISMMKSEGIYLEDFPAESQEFEKLLDEYSRKFKRIEKKVAKCQSIWETEMAKVMESRT